MHPGRFLTLVVIVLSVVAGGCSTAGDRQSPSTSSAADPSSDAAADAEPPIEGLALVETPLVTGSGILLDGDLLVTTAHVVWPYRRVDVRFLDGALAADIEVVAVDWIADLALVDLAGRNPPSEPARIGSGASVGDTVTLVGFSSTESRPDVVETTITGSRSWVPPGLDYVETGGPIGGGHSGGAVLDADGSIAGIITIELADGGVLSLSATDLADRIDAMLDAADPGAIGLRWLDDLVIGGEPAASSHALDEATWLLQPPAGAEVRLSTDSDVLSGSVIGPDGFLEATLEEGSMSFVATVAGPHFAALVPGASAGSVLDLSATVDLTRLADPDHGREIARGETLFANIDRPGDLDWFVIDLRAGETIEVAASSPNADLALLVGPIESLDGPESAASSDGAGGVLGSDPALVYEARKAGRHVVVVFDETQFGPGAYALTIGA